MSNAEYLSLRFLSIYFIFGILGANQRVHAQQIDTFCFAGQSNMVGWTTGGQWIGGSPEFLSELVTEFDTSSSSSSSSQLEATNLENIMEPYHTARNVFDAGVLNTEVSTLLEMHGRGLTSGLTTDLSDATFSVPQYGTGPISVRFADGWYSGISYGPEYMFSRVMQTVHLVGL